MRKFSQLDVEIWNALTFINLTDLVMVGNKAMSIFAGVEFRVRWVSWFAVDSELHTYKNTHIIITSHNKICKITER